MDNDKYGRESRRLLGITSLCLLIVFDLSTLTSASARGGGQNLQNWSGYQQRLQESRGEVTNRSVSQPYTTPPSAYPGKKWKKRGKRK